MFGADGFYFDAEDSDKIARMLRESDRRPDREQNVPEDFRHSPGAGVAVRITGAPDEDNGGMYPGVVVGWKPGAMAVGTETGDDSSFEEWGDVWWATKNEDDEVADDIWLKVGIEGYDEDLTETTVNAILVGEHPSGVPVALWTPDPASAKKKPYPLDELPCIAKKFDEDDGYLVDVNFYQKWYDPETGIVTCRQWPTCAEGCEE